MSLPRYTQYKDSAIDHLGSVPAHWGLSRLRYVCTINPSKAELSSIQTAGIATFLPMETIGEDGSLRLDLEKPVSELLSGYTYFREGDVVVAKITPCFENGKAALVKGLRGGIGFGTTELIVMRPRSEVIDAEYLFYLTRTERFLKLGEASMYGAGGQKRVPDSFARDFAISLPPVPEQQHIARFLNREIARIDALVAEQERLIELLHEKRKAAISHSVNEGLDPTITAKESGIDWPKRVPAHYAIVRIGREIELQRGTDITKGLQNEEGKVPVVSSGGIASFHDVALEKGPGVLVGRKGTAGAVHWVDEDYWPHDTTLYVRAYGSNLRRFVYYRLLSMDLKSLDSGSANPTLNRNRVHPILLPWPPVDEQRAIAHYLDSETLRIGELISNAERAMGLLAERRSALISAAVTGQIDVRGLVEPATA